MRRTTYILQSDNPEVSNLYSQSLADIKNEVASFLPKEPDRKVIDGEWPDGNFFFDDFHAEYREWQGLSVPPDYLFQLTYKFGGDYSPWRVGLVLASIGDDRLILEEVWALTTRRLKMPFESMPCMTAFLDKYKCRNEDGLFAGKRYSVSDSRIPEFIEFLLSDERQLPVLLFSPLPDRLKSSPYDRKEISSRLTSSAHLVALNNKSASELFGEYLPRHPCSEGAVRVFWPGLRREDDPAKHRIWRVDKMRNLSINGLRLVALNALQVNVENREISQLKRKQDLQHRKTRKNLSKSLDLLVVRRKAVTDAQEWKELLELADREIATRDTHIEILEGDLNVLRAENRQFRWRLTSSWQSDGDEIIDQVSRPRLYLSKQARSKYTSLNKGEIEHFSRQVLSKLLDTQLRNSQSEPLSGPSASKCHVFPRGRSAGGRRVVFYCDDGDVYVCEIYTLSEHDSDYSELRSTGVDPISYGGFRELELDGSLLRDEEGENEIAI